MFFVLFFILHCTYCEQCLACLTVRCGLGQRGVYGQTLPLFWGKHTPRLTFLFFFFSFLTRQLAASHQFGIKTKAICNQQLLIGGGEPAVYNSVAARVTKRSATGFSAGERKSYSHFHWQACHYLILGSRELTTN